MKLSVSLLATVLAFTLGIADCVTAAADEGVVKIGEIEAQTGAFSTYGWMSSQGVRMAVAEINAKGGFKVAGKTYKFKLFNPDTQGNPQQALIDLKQMLGQEHVTFVLGPFLTNVFKGIEAYANQYNGKFLELGGATQIHYELTKPGHDYLMRSWNWDAGSEGFGTLMVNYLKKQGVKKVAMLMQNDAFGHVAGNIYSDLFKKAGIEFQENWYEPHTTDFSAVLAKIAAWKPDYVFPGYDDSALYDIVHQGTELGLTHFWLVRGSLGPGLKNKDYIDDYVIYIPKYFRSAEKTEPKVAKFIADYKKFYHTNDFPYDQAPLCSSSCYDQVYMLVEAMQRAGTVSDPAKIRKALQSFTYHGVWNIRYDKTGEAVFDFDIIDMKRGGKLVVTHVEPK